MPIAQLFKVYNPFLSYFFKVHFFFRIYIVYTNYTALIIFKVAFVSAVIFLDIILAIFVTCVKAFAVTHCVIVEHYIKLVIFVNLLFHIFLSLFRCDTHLFKLLFICLFISYIAKVRQ